MTRPRSLALLPTPAAACRRPLLLATPVPLDGGRLRLAGDDGRWCEINDADGRLRDALGELDGVRLGPTCRPGTIRSSATLLTRPVTCSWTPPLGNQND